MRVFRNLLCGVAVAAIAGAAHAATLYQNNFDGNEATHTGVTGGFSGVTTTTGATLGAWNAAGWSGAALRNDSSGNPAAFTTLSLSNLAAHTTISMSFILGFLESWDSYNVGQFGPDNLEVWIDGVQVGNMTTDTALGTTEDYDGGTELFEGIHSDTASNYYTDVLVDMSTASYATFAHTASTLTIGIRATGTGWQGGSDEGWGIDNLVITYDGVREVTPGIPEPSTWAMMIAGFGLAGATLRRRRTATA